MPTEKDDFPYQGFVWHFETFYPEWYQEVLDDYLDWEAEIQNDMTDYSEYEEGPGPHAVQIEGR